MLAKEWNVFLSLIPRLRKKMHATSRQNPAVDGATRYTPAQIDTLYTIATRPEWRMSDLSARLQVSAGSLTTMVNRLIDAGVVERSRSQQDRRVVIVRLNETGEALVKANRDQFMDNLKELMADLPQTEKDRLAAAVGTMIEILVKII